MEWLVFTLLLAALAVVGYIIYRKMTAKPAAKPHDDFIGDQSKVQVDQLKQLRNGDVVEHLGHNWFVRGQLSLDEDGYRWNEFMLDDAERKTWLCLEDDESFEVTLWRSIPLGDVEQGQPGDRVVTVGGTEYTLQERGVAAFTAHGSTGTAPSGTVAYADYAGPDGALLGFERWGSNWEPALGETLQPWELTVYPSTDRPAQL